MGFTLNKNKIYIKTKKKLGGYGCWIVFDMVLQMNSFYLMTADEKMTNCMDSLSYAPTLFLECILHTVVKLGFMWLIHS